jgi:hypothetical protein
MAPLLKAQLKGGVVSGAQSYYGRRGATRDDNAPVARRALAWWWAFGLFVLSGCHASDHFSDNFLRLYAAPNPVFSHFYECHGFGCSIVSHIELTQEEWQMVRAEFTPPSADARGERRQIADAVALVERLVGARTGTSAHQWTRHNGHIAGNPRLDPTQLDCIDESVNTWTYLTLFARDGLLRQHQVTKLAYAGGLPDFAGAPRNTAVIWARDNGKYFAVDPTLVDAGEKPPIIPLSVWQGPWPPPLSAKTDSD